MKETPFLDSNGQKLFVGDTVIVSEEEYIIGYGFYNTSVHYCFGLYLYNKDTDIHLGFHWEATDFFSMEERIHDYGKDNRLNNMIKKDL